MGDHGRCAGGETLQAGKLYVDRQSGRRVMIIILLLTMPMAVYQRKWKDCRGMSAGN